MLILLANDVQINPSRMNTRNSHFDGLIDFLYLNKSILFQQHLASF